MENRVEVVETSNVSPEEIERFFDEVLDIAELNVGSNSPVIEEYQRLAQEAINITGIPVEALEPQTPEPEIEEPKEESNPEMKVIIPPNSPSLLVEESSSRFSSAVWYNAVRAKSITLAGVGGIGSYIAFLLSRMKPASLTIYDPDTVEEVNMSGQLYSKKNVGKTKVDSIAEMMADYSNFFNTMSIADRFTGNSPAENIMICGFDNMKARNLFFNRWLLHVSNLPEEEKKKCLFIDGRLAAEEFQVFCITGDDIYHQNIYKRDHLFSDAEADETICSYKQTSHCANMIGSIIVNLFVNFVANECNPLIPRDLPFITTYDAERMYFKTSI